METGTVTAAAGLPVAAPPSVPSPISASLTQALARVIATVPPDKRGSLTLDVTLDGATADIAHTLAANWTVAAYGAYWWTTGTREAGVRLTGSW